VPPSIATPAAARGPHGAAEHRVLGIDPGLAHLGIGAVVETGRDAQLVFAELVRTLPSEADGVRLERLHHATLHAIDRLRPHALALEGQYFHRQREAAFKVGQAVGVVRLAAHVRGVAVYEYGPLEVKQTLVGTGRADKAQVAFMVRALLGAAPASAARGHHASDALALALTHLARRRIAAAATLPR
jgi:crossover junction endodeoxyribonuclease RuvC